MANTREEFLAIAECAKRAMDWGYPGDRLSTMMDLEYSRINVAALMASDAETFAHDISGLYRHFDRRTMSWTDCFVPRVGLI